MYPYSPEELAKTMLAGMREHIGEAIANSADQFTSELSMESSNHGIVVRNKTGKDELHIQISGSRVAMYLADRHARAWDGAIHVFNGTLSDPLEGPRVINCTTTYEHLSGPYRYVLKAINADVSFALSGAARVRAEALQRELALIADVWDLPRTP